MNFADGTSLPLVTVVTVVYNGADYLERTISSVLNLGYENLVYSIVDGGSTDGTLQIIKKYEDRLNYWISEKDNGIYDAMNKGWEMAAANSFVLFLGAGDRIVSLPDNMERYGVNDVIYGDVYLGDSTVFKARVGFHLKIYNSLHHQALLINKFLYTSMPFDTRYRMYADFDFNQRLYKMGVNFVFSEKFKSYALPGGISDTPSFRESLMVIRKNFGIIWTVIATVAFLLVRFVPGIKKLRPIVENIVGNSKS